MIIIAGTIGAGKSSLAEALGQHLGTDVFYESVDDNPVLDLYYDDPEKYAFLLQIHFLNKRFKAIKKAYQSDNNILDRSIFEDALFMDLNAKNGNVTAAEHTTYHELLDIMLEELDEMPKHKPDLLVYVDVSFETMLERIKLRGREFEQIDDQPDLKEYYKQVHDMYPDWYENYNKSPKLRIDGDKLDFVNNPEDLAEILGMVDDNLKAFNLI